MSTPRHRPAKPVRPVVLTATLGLALAVLAAGVVAGRGQGRDDATTAVFQALPYIQPGTTTDGRSAMLLWQTPDGPTDTGTAGPSWSAEVRVAPGGPWVAASPTAPSARRVAIDGLAPFRIHRAAVTGLTPGAAFDYRVKRDGDTVFEAAAKALPPSGSPQRFVVFGDCAAATPAQKAVAVQAFQARPDYLVVTGDVVYSRGRVSEYLDHFFGVYNAETTNPALGAPLLRARLMFAAPGNHDLIEGDLDRFPDGLAYYYFWDQPRNGPVATADAPGATLLKGSPARRATFLDAAGSSYPSGANFSFDVGDVHWTVLDSNTYVDWTDRSLRAWLDADLASPAARKAAWRLVAFHHTVFHSGKAHADDQRMRLLAPAFEAGRVDVVFSGHVHNYQRSLPLKFAPGPPPADGRGKPYGPNGQVDGEWTLDRGFDGRTRVRPDGVIYIVTGAGGAKLYDPTLGDDPGSWKPYTAKVVTNIHSITVVDVAPTRLSFRQVADDGREVDRFEISR